MRRKATVSAFKDIESGLTLKYRPRQVVRAAGAEVSKQVKRALRRGKEPDGKSLPRPEGGGRPLRDSGSLIKSIGVTVSRRRGEWVANVWARGNRSDLGRSLGGRQAGLLAVLIYGRKSEHKRPRMDPMRYVAAMTPKVEEAVEKQLNRQLTSGRAHLLTGRRARGSVDRGLAGRLLARKRR